MSVSDADMRSYVGGSDARQAQTRKSIADLAALEARAEAAIARIDIEIVVAECRTDVAPAARARRLAQLGEFRRRRTRRLTDCVERRQRYEAWLEA